MNAVKWAPTVHDGQPARVAAGTGLRVVVVPGVGGKIVSVLGPSGHEHVWRQPGRRVEPVVDGRDFADADISGLDDCFPTVDACRYPAPATDAGPVTLRDHGDVWHRAWSVCTPADSRPGALELRTTGDELPYVLTKRLTVDDNRLVVGYELTTVDRPFTYQWTAHLLLRATPGRRIDITGEPSARTAFATGGRLAARAGETWTWPAAPGPAGKAAVDLSVVGEFDLGVNEKSWLTSPADGRCRIEGPPHGDDATVEFDPTLLPWLALCTDYGGWPTAEAAHWVAVEPSTGSTDTLDQSATAGTARTIEPGATHRWWWALRLDPTTTR
jgi:hypothetical protein